MLTAQSNLATTYERLGRSEEALRVRRDVYTGNLKLNGEENERTLGGALNYSTSLVNLRRFEEATSLLRKTLPVARRVLGDSHELTLRLRWQRAYVADDLREAVNTLEEVAPTARRVLGGAHPLTKEIEEHLRQSRAALRARETP